MGHFGAKRAVHHACRGSFHPFGEIDDVAMKYSFTVAVVLLTAVGSTERPAEFVGSVSTVDAAEPAVGQPSATLHVAAHATTTAVRVDPPAPATEQVLLFGTGLHGRPFAPADLVGCDEMAFYRLQWGLPASFDTLGWRESGCRNEENVRTSCCVGYWQLYVSSFVRDLRAAPRLASECAVYSSSDVDSDAPVDKQRQACAAAVVYSIQGFGAWSL